MIKMQIVLDKDEHGASIYKLKPSVITIGNQLANNVDTMCIDYPEEWRGLTIRATFIGSRINDEPIALIIPDDGVVEIGESITGAKGVMVVDAFEEGYHAYTTNTTYTVANHAKVGGTEPTYTPTQIEQILSNVQVYVNQATEQANIAKDYSIDASASASLANDKAGVASDAANTATGAAGLANESATSASRSAESAANSVSEVNTLKRDTLHYRNEAEQFATEAKQDYTSVKSDIDRLDAEDESIREALFSEVESLNGFIDDEIENRIRVTNKLGAEVKENTESLDRLWKLNKGQTYDFEEKVESGMSVAPSGAKYMTLDEVHGKTEQTQYNGYQLLDVDEFMSISFGFGCSATVNNGEISIVDTGGGGYDRLESRKYFVLHGGDVITVSYKFKDISGGILSNVNKIQPRKKDGTQITTNGTLQYNTNSFTFSCTSDVEMMLQFYVSKDGSTSVGDKVTYYDIMLEKGTTVHAYEPFVGGLPVPRPNMPSEITSIIQLNFKEVGKNLLDQSDLSKKGFWYQQDGTLVPNGNWCAYLIPIKGGTTFTISGLGSNAINMPYLDENMSAVGLFAHRNTTQIAPANARYLAFSWVWNPAVAAYDGDHVQVEYGSTASEYEPYSETEAKTIIPPHPLNKIGDYVDICDVVSGEWKYNLKNVRLNGDITEDVVSYRIDSTNRLSVYIYIDNTGGTYVFNPALSDRFKLELNAITYPTYDNKFNFRTFSTGSFRFDFVNDAFTSREAAIEYVRSNPIDLVYLLIDRAESFPINASDLVYLRSLKNIDASHHLIVTDQNGNDVSYLLDYIIKLDER